MIVEELMPAVEAQLGLAVTPWAAIGWSMGGYGALLLAQRHPDRFKAVVAASPALWRRFDEAAAGAFDSEADFSAHDVFDGVDRLAGLRVRVDCGRSDGFAPRSREFAELLPNANLGTFGRGYHDASYWRSVASAQVTTIADSFANR
jgi:S-formylglutathione hydrolase FrmB